MDAVAFALVDQLPATPSTSDTTFAGKVRSAQGYLATVNPVAAGVAGLLPTTAPSAAWSTIGALNYSVSSAAVSTDGSRIFVSNGSWSTGNSAQGRVIDPTTGFSAALPAAPTAKTAVAGAWCNGAHYSFGGLSGTTALQSLDAYTPSGSDGSAGVWTTRQALGSANVAYGAAVAIGNFIYVAGGQSTSATSSAVATLYRYDTTANTWTTLPSMPAARTQGSMVAVGTKLYYLGGYATNQGATTTVYVYDTVAGTWSTASWSTTINSGATNGGAVVVNGLIYNLGQNPGQVTGAAYDPTTGAATPLPAVPTSHGSFPGTVAVGSSIYLVSGASTANVDKLDVGALPAYQATLALLKALVAA